MKEKLERTKTAALPFEATRKAPWGDPGIYVNLDERGDIPCFTYEDIGLTIRNTYEEDVVIFRKFESGYDNYCIIALEIGVSEPAKQLLATYGSQGNAIDHLEAGIYWGGLERLCIKQWRINTQREVIVSWIKILSDKTLRFYDEFPSVQGQRIDTRYRINSSGKFQKIKETLFEPKAYTKSYLEGEKNLWEGNEIVKEEISF